jgi:hypothetical protein
MREGLSAFYDRERCPCTGIQPLPKPYQRTCNTSHVPPETRISYRLYNGGYGLWGKKSFDPGYTDWILGEPTYTFC